MKQQTIEAMAALVQSMEGEQVPFVLLIVDKENECVSIGSNIPSRDGLNALGRWMGGMIEKSIDENSVAYAAREVSGREPWPQAGIDSCTFIPSEETEPAKGTGVGWRGPYFTTGRGES